MACGLEVHTLPLGPGIEVPLRHRFQRELVVTRSAYGVRMTVSGGEFIRPTAEGSMVGVPAGTLIKGDGCSRVILYSRVHGAGSNDAVFRLKIFRLEGGFAPRGGVLFTFG